MNCCTKQEGIDSPGMTWPRMLLVPLPMAMFGVVVAFMFGATLGMVMGRKREMMMRTGCEGGKPWMHRGMKRHHHHGDGSPACRESHDDWPRSEMPPTDDATEQ
jgi:hypothetical protein